MVGTAKDHRLIREAGFRAGLRGTGATPAGLAVLPNIWINLAIMPVESVLVADAETSGIVGVEIFVEQHLPEGCHLEFRELCGNDLASLMPT